MIPIKVTEPTFQVDVFEEERLEEDWFVDLDTIEKLQRIMQIHEVATTIRVKPRYNPNLTWENWKRGIWL